MSFQKDGSFNNKWLKREYEDIQNDLEIILSKMGLS
jgi:hypothetical protein